MNKTWKKLTSLKGDNSDPYESSQSKLHFMNLLNQAGCQNKPVIFQDYARAKDSCPLLAKVCEKLTTKERDFIIDRINNLL